MSHPTSSVRGRTAPRRRSTANRSATVPPRSAGSPRGAGSSRSARPARASGRASSPARAALDAALEAALQRSQPEVETFAELGVPPRLVAALARAGVHRPFAIQTRALPDAMAGRDVLGRAQTGSGKTLAFGLPVLARLAGDIAGSSVPAQVPTTGSTAARRRRTPHAPRALVLVPTRELAQQVTTALAPLADSLALTVTSVVGGAPYGRQINALERGVDILVATPGRLVDLIERRSCRLDAIEITVLDEADYMADLGFLPVVTDLLSMTPDGTQRLLFSATLDNAVATLVERFLHDPVVHAVAPATASVSEMTHRVFTVRREDKTSIAAEVASRPARTLFFVRTKHGADRLARQLGQAGVEAAAIHGNLGQGARNRALSAFAAGSTRVLVATDVAARGIHVDGVDLVVHFDPPNDHKDYLHRSGRTARAGAEGTVVALVQPDQLREVQRLHEAASVSPIVDVVHPGHPVVREVASSGEPIVVVPVQRETDSGRMGSGGGRGYRARSGGGRRPRPGR